VASPTAGSDVSQQDILDTMVLGDSEVVVRVPRRNARQTMADFKGC
jgi:hypothetical protein